MKILTISALYPPYAFGGAEDCAKSFSEWAATQGHDVRVLMAAREPDEVGTTRRIGPVEVTMLDTPHIYPVSRFDTAPGWQKPIWHLQDHIARQTGRAIAEQVRAFAPDVVLIHYIQGFGYQSLAHLAECKVPTVFVLHDLGLACVRMSMFRNGRDCNTQCGVCRVSTAVKSRLIKRLGEAAPIGFAAPSQAVLDSVGRFVPIKTYPNRRLLNTKSYPRVARVEGDGDRTLRLLYAGKLDAPKGIEVLAAGVERLAETQPVKLTLAGKGPLEGALRDRYGHTSWFRYLGFVSQETLAEEMARADLLCVPSLWQENSPGVVIQALSNGLPVAATDRGGLSELITDNHNGILLRVHDMDDWAARLQGIADDRELLARLKVNTDAERDRFEVDVIGRETIGFLEEVVRNEPGSGADR